MDYILGFASYLVPAIVVMTVVVFVHELGHYLVAKWAGVRVLTFSIGFGPEIFGWNDRSGTRWKVAWLPLGGFVRFFGDADASSKPDVEGMSGMSAEDKRVSFQHKPLGWRFAIVSAGPLANFLFAIVVLSGLFIAFGQPYTPPVVGSVAADSAGAEAGMLAGDRILSIDGSSIERFEDMQALVRLNQGTPLLIVVQREGNEISLTATPKVTTTTDSFGNTQRLGLLGVSRSAAEYVTRSPPAAVYYATKEIGSIIDMTLTHLGQMVRGLRGTEDLGGPLRIGEMSGQMAQAGLVTLVWFMAMISVNLGLINLFPVPMLDGGHLLFYAFEALRGKPLGETVQEYGFRFGLVMVLSLMVFATWNDLVHFRIVAFVSGLFS